MILAQNDVQKIFGTIKPPGPQALTDPGTGFTTLLTTSIQLALFIGSLMLLGYLFYGAFLYITSGGEQEKIDAARKTLTYAVIGIILLVIGLSVFSLVVTDILGIVNRDAQGNLYFKIPSIGGDAAAPTSPDPCQGVPRGGQGQGGVPC
jgi:xanthine/uracil permease